MRLSFPQPRGLHTNQWTRCSLLGQLKAVCRFQANSGWFSDAPPSCHRHCLESAWEVGRFWITRLGIFRTLECHRAVHAPGWLQNTLPNRSLIASTRLGQSLFPCTGTRASHATPKPSSLCFSLPCFQFSSSKAVPEPSGTGGLLVL